MASSKEPPSARPHSQHRLSSTPSMAMPGRHAGSRNHSHSISLGTNGPAHRVTRRKSMTGTAAVNMTAMAAALRGQDGEPTSILANSSRRLSSSKFGKTARMAGSPSSNMPHNSNVDSRGTVGYRETEDNMEDEDDELAGDSAITEGYAPATVSTSTKNRLRRASEGAHLSKDSKRVVSGELRCEKCGKGYKHSSCLTKHLWEHTPQWSYTSKLLISKHQQVQLLEAASVLVTMNQDAVTPSETMKANESDNSSASPEASASDIQDDETSSLETTPPPMSEGAYVRDSKRYSSNSSVFSRSYQSAPSYSASSVTAESYGSYHYNAYQRRPSSSGIAGHVMLEDEAGLAAAVELCNFGTPRTGPVHLPADIPPVPPLPERYQSHNANRSIGGTEFPTFRQELIPPPLTHRLSDERDVKMHEIHNNNRNDDYEEYYEQQRSRSRSDEDDDGVFGRMEE